MNPGKWKQMTERVARMDRAELRFRARQELAKRQDALLSLLRFNFGRSVARRTSAPRRGNFFFGPGDVESRLELLRQRLPDQVGRILKQADKILRHRFDLLGYEDLAYGRPIDWNLDLVHARRAPRKMFNRVSYLDFEEVGDTKITWELNRHQHLVTLAKAYRLTGDLRYADEVLRQWRDWRAENPYPIGINWTSSLEVAFRSMAWLWTCYLLENAPGLSDIREEWLRGLALHGRHIERYLSTYFSPNTHLLGEGVALFCLGVLCSELEAGERWKNLGWRIVLEEAQRQVRRDGFHFEQSTYYHVYALDLFLHAAILASANGISLPSEFEMAIERMLTALCLLGRHGAPPRLGDDDGGRLFDPRRNRSEHLLDPLATGAVLFHRGDFKSAVGQLTEEAIWLVGPEGARVWDELATAPPIMNSVAMEDSGLYLLPSETQATHLVVNCGPMGTQSGGHAHADALSVTLRSRENELLIDPGTCEYVSDGGERNLFRGTAMHNTLRVDGVDQAEPASVFSWKRLTQSKAEKWIQGKHFDLLAASHDGYQRLSPPVTHRRWVLSLKNGMYLVRDCVEGAGRHQIEISWHLGPELQLVEENVFRVKDASQGLSVIPVEGHGWAQQISKQPWSPVYGQKSPATVVTFSKRVDVPDDFCTLLVALEEARERPGTLTRVGGQKGESSVTAYRYVSADSEDIFLFGESGKLWREASVSSDAEFICWRRLHDPQDHRLILVNGSHAEVDGGPALRFARTVSWGELTMQEDRKQIFSSDPEAEDRESAPAGL
jgi:heparinase II/III-like protein